MARKAKLAPVIVVETAVQDELANAMAAMVSAPVEESGDVVTEVETVVLTVVEIPAVPEALAEFGPVIQDEPVVEVAEDIALFHGMTVQKFCRAFWKSGKRATRQEHADGTFRNVVYSKCLNDIWNSVDSPRTSTPSPYFLIIRADGTQDLMLQPE